MTPRWFLGAPFDVVTLRQAVDRVHAAVRDRRRLIFATPNVSFLAEASRNARFREDILRADLSFADGAPVVWLGRLTGIAFPERVAGSDLLDHLLRETTQPPLRIFFFGGESGAAEAAMEKVNRSGGGAIAVGAHYPGFVGIDQMSDNATIDLINRTRPDFLVVALGAAKGHRWMELNRDRLNAPVISHLGAAVNFVAGRLRRAPRLVQRLGMEWAWRILEEPALFKRYARDAVFLLRAVITSLLPTALARGAIRPPAKTMLMARNDGGLRVDVEHSFGAAHARAIDEALSAQGAVADARLVVNLRGVRQFDSESIGWLYMKSYRSPAPMTLHGDAATRAALGRWRAQILLDRAGAR